MTTFGIRRMSLIAFWLAVGAVALPARADDPATESLIRRGVELRKAERHEEALDLFQKAHALSPSGRTFGQMGLAEFSLKRFVDAETHLTAALDSNLPWVAHNRGPLEQALVGVRSHIAIVDVIGPAGAEVAVNGKSVGRLPLPAPFHLAEGHLRIEGTAPEHQPAALDVTVIGGRAFKVTLNLAPVVPPEPGQPTPPISTIPPTGVDHPAETSPASWRRWAGGGLVAVSAAAITTGIVWLAVDNNGTCNIPAGAPSGARCSQLYNTKAQGWAAIGAGAAAGLGGALLLWQGNQGDIQVGLGPRAVAAYGHF
jgi:hypothetical protein